MSSTHERIRQRRLYLAKKGWAYTKMSLNAVLAFPFALLVFVVLFLLGLDLIFGFHRHSFILICVVLADCVGVWFASRHWFRSMKKAHQEALQLPFVPPVIPDTLPAEEVLVRGSEEPAQEQGKVLLRGTDGSGSTGEQELLRSSQQEPLR